MKKKIVYIGSVQFSAYALQKLIELKAEIALVIAKESSVINADYHDISLIARDNGIDCIKTDNINNEEIISLIKEHSPDYLMCLGWSQLIKMEILSIPTIGTIGFHPALLPQNRGRHPIIWALALGLDKTGSTFFFMDEGADSGDIISQEMVEIGYLDNAHTLYDKIVATASRQLGSMWAHLDSGKLTRFPQDNSKANYWRKRSGNDGRIDWRMGSRQIYNLVRALTRPYVGAHFIRKNSEYKVWECREIDNGHFQNIEYGKVIKVNGDSTFLVKTGDSLIQVIDYQPSLVIKEGEYLQ